MKKAFTSFIAASVVTTAFISPAFAEKATVPTVSVQDSTINENVVTYKQNGVTVTKTTKVIHESPDKFLEKLKKEGHVLHSGSQGVLNNTVGTTNTYLQNNYFSGYGSAKSSASGQTGYISCSNGHVGFNLIGGHISAHLVASGATQNKPRLIVDTYGIFVGGSVVASTYTFTPDGYTSGSPSLNVDNNLSGLITYYDISAYGDYKAPGYNAYWNATANLQVR